VTTTGEALPGRGEVADFLERAGILPAESLTSLEAGLRLVLHL
jgi:hypothetical protein